jgi:Integrase core domain
MPVYRDFITRPIVPHSPGQNGRAERLIGSIRRECLDHVVVFGERHLRHMLLLYMGYYNKARTHLSLNKDAPVPRAVQTVGRLYANPRRFTLSLCSDLISDRDSTPDQLEHVPHEREHGRIRDFAPAR